VVLGAGYVGLTIVRRAAARGWPVVATSRAPNRHLASLPSHQRRLFDLAQPDTWLDIPPDTALVWCFPALPLDAVQRFAERHVSPSNRLVVLGSTSAYVTACHADAPSVDEAFPIDRARPRVQGEEWLRECYGAIVLRVAGIYGAGRNPIDWIRRGKVGLSDRMVNLVHVEDLAAIALTALSARRGEAYNVSDGHPRRWSEICAEAARRYGVTAQRMPRTNDPGKRISIEKLRRDLHYEFQDPDLYAALDEIEAGKK
jgi:nucleoside-diphosphate-sugar epimerase